MSIRNADITKTIETIGAGLEKFTDSYKRKLAEVDKDVEDIFDRVEELEARGNMPGKTAPGSQESMIHKKLFEDFLRHPFDGARKQALGDFQRQLEGKSVNLGSNADGAFALPEEISREIEKLEARLSPIRELVKVVRVSTGDFKHLVNIGGASAGWVAETTSRTETDTPQLRERAPTFGEVYSYPQVTEWAISDIFFDVAAWLAAEVAEQFSLFEAEAFVRGDGASKPTGFLNTAPVTTADDASPKRDAAALQYLLSGDNSPASIDYDTLVDTVFTLNARYKSNAKWIMNSTTAGMIAKLTDTTERPLWQPSMAAGMPSLLLGFPVVLVEAMDDPIGGRYPIGFGDWKRAYLLADRSELRITTDNNITTPGKVKFFVRRREGGCVLNCDSAKLVKLL